MPSIANCYWLALPVIIAISCQAPKDQVSHLAIPDEDLTQYVNPFIGTGGHGHTFPGATIPFGMVQLSPDTRLDGWDGCSGYHYSDEHIYGFSHTHLSGTGVSDYGDILLMPTNKVEFNNGADGKPGYKAHFSHDYEEAEAGYYKVLLDDTDILVELTTTPRTGIHRYTFPPDQDQVIILDLEHRDKLISHEINRVSDTVVQGHRNSEAWARDQRLFYKLVLSHPVKEEYYNLKENPTKAAFVLDNPNNEPVVLRVSISAVDEEGAAQNLITEVAGKDFVQVWKEAKKSWQDQLCKIVIEESDPDKKATFYTALYHSMIAPNLYQDVDGRYRGMDLEIHKAEDFKYYTVFSLWDTYRAAHPLFTIIEQERTNHFVKTMLAKYKEGGIIPIWDLSACYTGCMIGYHGVPVISDAYLKGIRDYDAEFAFEAIRHSAMQDHLGLESYKKYGFIPVEEESESVSKTLEYSYDDWTIAQMAKEIGKSEDYRYFIRRAQYYKNLYDPSTGFFRGRFRNTWFGPFNPYEVNFNYTEANAWQYSLYVPQDIEGHIRLMGGRDNYESHLDDLFAANTETAGRNQADITGLIGQYAHGNEPSHHMAYLYNFVNKPHKTQERVYQILNHLYKNAPDGISGNEDCGQMSAWYVFSALGFYPVTPGSNEYIIGTPFLEKATIDLENGNKFTVVANNLTDQNFYIEKAYLNGNQLDRSYIRHEEIMAGGSLVFNMASKPSDWATSSSAVPTSAIYDELIVPAPFIEAGNVAFKESSTIKLGHVDPQASIYYRLGESQFKLYTKEFIIKNPTVLRFFAEKDGIKSAELQTDFYKIDPTLSIHLESNYANEYSGGGENALIDGIRGTKDFRTGAWQGYQDQDVVAVVEMSEEREINSVSTSFLQDQRSWIFFPTKVIVEYSTDGETWETLVVKEINAIEKDDEAKVKSFEFKSGKVFAKQVRLTAITVGRLPEWHLGHVFDGRAWIFIDEIRIE